MRPLKTTPLFLKALCTFSLLSALSANASAQSIELGAGTLQIRKNGQIASFKVGTDTLISNGELVAQPAEGKTFTIPWNMQAEITAGAGQIEATGALTAEAANEGIRFNIIYNKAGADSFTLSARATYLEDTQWRRPAYYFLSFPASDYAGASIVVEDASGRELTYRVGDSALNIKGSNARRITFFKDGSQLSIQAAEGSRLLLLDSRNWGGKNIRLDIATNRPWKATDTTPAGTEDTFSATVTLLREE